MYNSRGALGSTLLVAIIIAFLGVLTTAPTSHAYYILATCTGDEQGIVVGTFTSCSGTNPDGTDTASADLGKAQLKATATAAFDGVVGHVTAQGLAEFQDAIIFQNLTSPIQVTVSLHVTGTMTPPVSGALNGGSGGLFQAALIFQLPSQTDQCDCASLQGTWSNFNFTPFSFQQVFGTGSRNIITSTNNALDFILSVTEVIDPINPTFPFLALLQVQATEGGSMNFGNTAQLSITVPPGVTFTSESGVLFNQQAKVVTALADAGPGSLRQAIIDANADGVATSITFDPVVFPPPPAAPGVILLSSALPTLTGTGDTIDGTGAGVVIEGSGGLPAGTVGLRIRRSNITIRGLIIQKFPGDGIRVETSPPPTTVTTVTGVVIDNNNLFANGSRGIRVTGGQGSTTAGGTGGGKTVAATITNNTVVDNVVGGIFVIGNLNSTGDFGGHNVTALINGNTVRRSQQQFEAGGPGGNGIQIAGGTGVGSNSVVTATVSNNSVHRNFDHGINATGCSSNGSSGSNNTVYATIINNSVRENGFNGDPTSNRDGIHVQGAAGATSDATTCAGNIMRFDISGNDTGRNRSRNIIVNGGSGSGHDLQGVVSGNTAKNTVDNNGITVSGGRGTGNVVHDVTVSENQVSDSFNNGISVSGGTESTNATVIDISVLSNHVFNNGNHGIIASGGTDTLNAAITGILIDGNLSTGNRNRGIQASTGSTTGAINPMVSLVGITNNTASSNADDGIFIGSGVPGSGTTLVSGNQADRNGVDGIDIDSSKYVLSNNTASRNAADGINAVGNTNGGGNKATQNASCNTPGCF